MHPAVSHAVLHGRLIRAQQKSVPHFKWDMPFLPCLTRAGFFVREPQRNSFDLLRAFRIRGSSRMGYPSTKCVCHLTLFFCKACFAHRLPHAAAFYTSRFRMASIAKRRIAALHAAIRQSHLLKLALASPATIVLGGMRDKPEKALRCKSFTT